MDSALLWTIQSNRVTFPISVSETFFFKSEYLCVELIRIIFKSGNMRSVIAVALKTEAAVTERISHITADTRYT